MRRRSLVITDDAARHPYLASLPRHVRRQQEARAAQQEKKGIDATWVREFLMAYCACFLAVTLFIF